MALYNTQLTLFQPIANGVTATVTSLCISPSKKCFEQGNMYSQHLKLKYFDHSLESDTLTIDCAMTIDNEPTAKPQLLQMPINKSVNKALIRHTHRLS